MRYSLRKPSIVVLVTLLVVGLVAPAAFARQGPPEHSNAPDHARGERPTPPEHAERGLLQSTLARMSLEEKVGQLFMTWAYGTHADDDEWASVNQANYGVDTPGGLVEEYHLGGMIYFAWSQNTQNPHQMNELSNSLQETAISQPAGIPLHIAIDQETGDVVRMTDPATEFPGAMALGATRDAGLAEDVFTAVGAELDAVGGTWNFAPVLDVNTNPDNPVIGVRSFGEDPGVVGELGSAGVAGLQSQGVSATPKHFPGHGDTDVDSHFGLPWVTYDEDELMDVHVTPFAEAIDAGADAVMTAHMVVDAIDPEMPATLSEDVLTGLLREELGFDGLIVTDALNMAALADFWDDDEIAVMALEAGADVLLMPGDLPEAYDGVLEAVQSGEISEQRIDESVLRILQAKYDRGLFHDPYSDPEQVDEIVGAEAHRALEREATERSLTLVRDEDELLPIDAETAGDVLVVETDPASDPAAGPLEGGAEVLAGEFAAHGVAADHVEATEEDMDAVLDQAADADLVVYLTAGAWTSSFQQELGADLAATGTSVAGVATRVPYDPGAVPEVETYLATYGTRDVSMEATARLLVGEFAPTGELPVTIPDADTGETLYEYGHGLTW